MDAEEENILNQKKGIEDKLFELTEEMQKFNEQNMKQEVNQRKNKEEVFILKNSSLISLFLAHQIGYSSGISKAQTCD